jgi:hypothetical protein
MSHLRSGQGATHHASGVAVLHGGDTGGVGPLKATDFRRLPCRCRGATSEHEQDQIDGHVCRCSDCQPLCELWRELSYGLTHRVLSTHVDVVGAHRLIVSFVHAVHVERRSHVPESAMLILFVPGPQAMSSCCPTTVGADSVMVSVPPDAAPMPVR